MFWLRNKIFFGTLLTNSLVPKLQCMLHLCLSYALITNYFKAQDKSAQLKIVFFVLNQNICCWNSKEPSPQKVQKNSEESEDPDHRSSLIRVFPVGIM